MKLHRTIGVYPDGGYKLNTVAREDLEGHVAYNVRCRPGRALIVDGVTVHPGIGVSPERIQAVLDYLGENVTPGPDCKVSRPYQ